MKIDLRQTIFDYEGKPIREPQQDPADPTKIIQWTKPLREYFSTALNNAAPGEIVTPEDKSEAYSISTKLFASNTVDLTAEQVIYLKHRILKIFISPLVCGRLIDVLEGREPEKILPEEDLKATAEEALVIKNADLSNVAAKDASKPPIQPVKAVEKTDGGE